MMFIMTELLIFSSIIIITDCPTVLGVWTVSMATLCWGQESIVGPVHVLATLAVTTPMGTPAMRTMPPTRSSATASRATQVNVFKNALWSFNLSAS